MVRCSQPSPILPGMTSTLNLLLGLVQENIRGEPTLGSKDAVSVIAQASGSAGARKWKLDMGYIGHKKK